MTCAAGFGVRWPDTAFRTNPTIYHHLKSHPFPSTAQGSEKAVSGHRTPKRLALNALYTIPALALHNS